MFEFAFLNWRRGDKVDAKATPTPAAAPAAETSTARVADVAKPRDNPRGDYGALTTPTPGLGSRRSAQLAVLNSGKVPRREAERALANELAAYALHAHARLKE